MRPRHAVPAVLLALGDGQTAPYSTRAVRVDFPAGVKIIALANPMSFDGALAIDSHGHAWG